MDNKSNNDNNFNIIVKNKNTNVILHYQNLALFTISWLSLFACIHYKITKSYYYLYYLIQIISIYAFVDLFYTKNIDSKIHHTSILGLVFYVNYFLVDYNDIQFLIYSFIQTEISSIFLVLTYYINKKSVYYYLNSIIFYILFFKFRIYDFYFNIIRYDSVLYITTSKYTPDNFCGSSIFIVSGNVLYILNVYWFILLSKLFYKKFVSKKSNEKI
jgi:hypothetical protein